MPTSTPNTFDELSRLLAADFADLPPIGPEAELADLGLDSLALVDLMFLVEEHFGVDLPGDTSRLRTVRDLVALIDARRVPCAA